MRRLRTPGLGTKILLTALSVLIPLVFLGCTQDPVVRKQQHVERGSRFLEEGKYNEAVIELKNALQLDPTFVPALYALGRAYYAKGWYLDAARELSRAAEREAGAIPIRLLLGLIEPTSGRAEVLGYDTATQGQQIRDRVGALLEHTGLYERLTAEDNLDYFASIWGMTGAAKRDPALGHGINTVGGRITNKPVADFLGVEPVAPLVALGQ